MILCNCPCKMVDEDVLKICWKIFGCKSLGLVCVVACSETAKLGLISTGLESRLDAKCFLLENGVKIYDEFLQRHGRQVIFKFG